MRNKKYLISLLAFLMIGIAHPVLSNAGNVWSLVTNTGITIPLKYVDYIEKDSNTKYINIVRTTGDVIGNVRAVTYEQREDYLMGDANGDKSVTVFDATLVTQRVLNIKNASFNSNAADMNTDNKISVYDATLIINKILNK